MENLYNDDLLPDDFEQMAKAYSKKLKDKGFVFVRLEEEEIDMLVSEVFVILAKMKACTQKLSKVLECKKLENAIETSCQTLEKVFIKTKPHNFVCVENENSAFLCLVSLENTLVLKLMLLSIKSGELEVCNAVITNISSIFAESFSMEGFQLL